MARRVCFFAPGDADLPEEALLARRFGADGLGLVPTERMLLRPAPLRLLRTAILMDGPRERELSDRALQRLEWPPAYDGSISALSFPAKHLY